nr:hypothetical protein [Tanacetum cinerariifolium]
MCGGGDGEWFGVRRWWGKAGKTGLVFWREALCIAQCFKEDDRDGERRETIVQPTMSNETIVQLTMSNETIVQLTMSNETIVQLTMSNNTIELDQEDLDRDVAVTVSRCKQTVVAAFGPRKDLGPAGYLIIPFQVFSIWKAFRGNKRDLGSFRDEMDKITNQHQDSSRFKDSKPGDDVTIYTRRRHTSSSDGVTTSFDGVSLRQINSDLEDYTL